MLPYFKSYPAVSALFVMLVAAGCQTASQPPRSALVKTPQGQLACRDCTVATLQDPVTDPKGEAIGSRPRTVMVCPDCKDYLDSTGEDGVSLTKHECKTCGKSVVICSMHSSH